MSPGRCRRLLSFLMFKNEAEAEALTISFSLGTRALIRKGQSNRSFKLTTHFYLMPRFRISGVRPLLLNMCSWRAKGRLYLNKIGDDIFYQKWDITYNFFVFGKSLRGICSSSEDEMSTSV